MKNQISGDFDSETLEEFRAMYAQREVAPEDLEVDNYTGLPTNVITNVSPWIEHTGLWRANPGTERDFVPNQVLPGSLEQNFEDIRDFDNPSKEELDALTEKVISEIEEEEAFADLIYNSDDEDDDDPNVYRGEVEEGMSDDELERIISSILADDEEDERKAIAERDSLEIEEDTMSDEDLDNLINELLRDTEDAEDGVSDVEDNEVYSDEDLDNLINELLSDSEDAEDGSEDNEVAYDDEEIEEVETTSYEEEDDSGNLEENSEEEEMSEEEIDNLIDQIMSEFDEEDSSEDED
jgi:hypothetical protein